MGPDGVGQGPLVPVAKPSQQSPSVGRIQSSLNTSSPKKAQNGLHCTDKKVSRSSILETDSIDQLIISTLKEICFKNLRTSYRVNARQIFTLKIWLRNTVHSIYSSLLLCFTYVLCTLLIAPKVRCVPSEKKQIVCSFDLQCSLETTDENSLKYCSSKLV